MNNNQKFFRCNHCGNLIGLVNNAGVPLVCCGENMQELIPNTTEASEEKHLPVATIDGEVVTVKVGSILHPMEEAHYIKFIYLETKNGGQRKSLKAGDSPEVKFSLINDEVIAVYAYCNIHGLWMVKL